MSEAPETEQYDPTRTGYICPDEFLTLPTTVDTASLEALLLKGLSIVRLGYKLTRPAPDDWARTLTPVVSQLQEIVSLTLKLDKELPSVKEAIEDTRPPIRVTPNIKRFRASFKRARSSAWLLLGYLKTPEILDQYIDDIHRHLETTFDALKKHLDWYLGHPRGAVSFLLLMNPILGPAFAAYNISKLRRWHLDYLANNDGRLPSAYPFNAIPTHVDHPFVTALRQAYEHALNEVSKTVTSFENDSKRLFPFEQLNSLDFLGAVRHYYLFDGTDFTHDLKSDARTFPPHPKYDDYFLGNYYESSQDKLVVNLTGTGYYGDHLGSAYFARGGRRARPERYVLAKAAADAIATAQWEMSRVGLINTKIKGHQKNLKTLKSKKVWG